VLVGDENFINKYFFFEQIFSSETKRQELLSESTHINGYTIPSGKQKQAQLIKINQK